MTRPPKLREQDNLFHIYALFAETPHIANAAEHLFLWLITGSGPRNKHGVMVTTEHVDRLCELMAAEAAFGLPRLYFDSKSSLPRYSRLDLTHMISDLLDALRMQTLTGNFVRPLLPSLLYMSHVNFLKVQIANMFSIKDLTHPHSLCKQRIKPKSKSQWECKLVQGGWWLGPWREKIRV